MPVHSKFYAISFMQSVAQLMKPTKFTGFFMVSGQISPLSQLPIWHKLFSPVSLISSLKLRVLKFFKNSLETLAPPVAAFTANRSSSHRGGSSFRHNRGRGYGPSNNSSHSGQSRTHTNQGRRPPRCQICRLEGHYADRCKQRYDQHEPTSYLAESDWLLDTGALAHMTPDNSTLEQSTAYTGKECVIVGNGASLPITHTSNISQSPDLKLLDVLVVPHLTKNLLSISKLTNDFPLSVTFANNFFTVQNCLTGKVVATGRRDGGLYVLERGNSAFIYVLKNKSLHASYDLWHARLKHVNHSILALLNKKDNFISPLYCHLLNYVTHVNLQKIIACLILVMNTSHQMC